MKYGPGEVGAWTTQCQHCSTPSPSKETSPRLATRSRTTLMEWGGLGGPLGRRYPEPKLIEDEPKSETKREFTAKAQCSTGRSEARTPVGANPRTFARQDTEDRDSGSMPPPPVPRGRVDLTRLPTPPPPPSYCRPPAAAHCRGASAAGSRRNCP